MVFELIAHLNLQGNARIKHHAQQTNDLEVFIQVGMHLLDGVDQVCQTFEREILALHGDDHPMRCTQAIQREHGERWRAIDQHKVIVLLY